MPAPSRTPPGRRCRASTGCAAGPLAVCAALVAVNVAWLLAGTLGSWPPETMWTLPTFLALLACGIGAAVLAHARRPGRGSALVLLALGWGAVLANGWWHTSGTGLLGHVVADLP